MRRLAILSLAYCASSAMAQTPTTQYPSPNGTCSELVEHEKAATDPNVIKVIHKYRADKLRAYLDSFSGARRTVIGSVSDEKQVESLIQRQEENAKVAPVCVPEQGRELANMIATWGAKTRAELASELACRKDAKCVAKRELQAKCDNWNEDTRLRAALVLAMAQERKNPSGYVDKAKLYQIGADIQRIDETRAQAKAEGFDPKVCK